MFKLITPKNNRKLFVLKKKLMKFAQLLEKEYQYKIFATLTFAHDVSDDEASRLLKNYLQWLRDNGYDFKYFWVKELTKRGRIHYHIIFFSNTYILKPDISGWKAGMSRVEIVRKSAYSYVCKYLSKEAIPGRSYGYSRGVLNSYNQIPLWLWDKGYSYRKFRGRYFLFKSGSCWGFLKWTYTCGVILMEGSGTFEFLSEWFPDELNKF